MAPAAYPTVSLTAEAIRAGGYVASSLGGPVAASMLGPREPRFHQMQHIGQDSNEDFQIRCDAVFKQLKANNDAFEAWRTRGGKKTNEQIADYWRRNSSRYQEVSQQFLMLKAQSDRMNEVSQRIVANAEYRMTQWPLTQWLHDNGICTIL